MAVVRRHWAFLLAIPCLIAILVLAVLQQPASTLNARASDVALTAFVAQTQPSTADLVAGRIAARVYMRTQQLRKELALTNQDLASLGVSASTAGQVITDVKVFLSSPTDPLAAANAMYASAERAINEAVRQINTGEGGASVLSSLPTLKQNRDNAAVARLSAMAPVIAQVNALLTADQQAMWQSARAYAQLERLPGSITAKGALRYVSGLTPDQIEQFDTAARQGGQAGSAAASVLSSNQLAVIQTARQNLQASIAGVSVAEAAVLPMPTLLKPRKIATTRPRSPFSLHVAPAPTQ